MKVRCVCLPFNITARTDTTLTPETLLVRTPRLSRLKLAGGPVTISGMAEAAEAGRQFGGYKKAELLPPLFR